MSDNRGNAAARKKISDNKQVPAVKQDNQDKLLIQEVKCFKALYDKQAPFYYDIGKRNCIWATISIKLDEDKPKERWTKIRGSYVTSKKEGKSYKYSDIMTFLDSHIKEASANLQEDHGEKEKERPKGGKVNGGATSKKIAPEEVDTFLNSMATSLKKLQPRVFADVKLAISRAVYKAERDQLPQK